MDQTTLGAFVSDARERTFELIADLSDDHLMGPQLAIVNPPLWEIGHVAWFQEKWVLRHLFRELPGRPDADELYDSAAIAHDTRWDLLLPSRDETLAYMRQVRDRVLDRLDRGSLSELMSYFIQLSVFHEDMHTEAFTYTRQTLGYTPPRFNTLHHSPRTTHSIGPLPGDVEIPGGTFWLGATQLEPFVFDNEKWLHAVELEPFAIARAAVTQGEFAEFVEAGGYRRAELWSKEGWRWSDAAGAERPAYWHREPSGGWLRRHFDRWLPLEPHLPVIHVNWYEADAYCRWAGRRLPTEAEWELAATGPCRSVATSHGDKSMIRFRKPRFPWGDNPPDPRHANLDWQAMGCVDVAACPEGDSPFGCRQMIGNVWEWTASDFLPYPAFVADPYKDYSEPWFGNHKVLRGGCWTTRTRLLRNTWRNFYTPDRGDVWAGFRTCAITR